MMAMTLAALRSMDRLAHRAIASSLMGRGLLLAQLSQERIRREIRHFAQSMQCNMFALKLGPLDKNDNRIRAVGDEISKIVTNSDDVHLEFHWMFRHL